MINKNFNENLLIESVKPKIFNKKSNTNNKIIAYKNIGELHGLVKQSPPASLEWTNSVYSYNSNYNKLLTTADKSLITLVKSYVNMKFKRLQKQKKIKKAIAARLRLNKYRGRNKGRFRSVKKRLSVNKIFVSKGNIKHTSTRAIITIFLLKKMDSIVWLKSVKRLVRLIFARRFGKRLERIWNKKLKYKHRKTHRRVHFRLLRKQKLLFMFYLKNILTSKESYLIYLKTLKKNLRNNTSILGKKNSINPRLYYKKKGSFVALTEYRSKLYQKVIFKYNRYLKTLKLNELKFKKNFLENFRKIASKMYNKNVTFNFVKLNKMFLNSNIYTQIVALKLKRRELSVSRVLGKSLINIKLPRLPTKGKIKTLKKHLHINHMHHKNIFEIIKFKQEKSKGLWFELLLFKFKRFVNPFSLFGRMKLIHRKSQKLQANKKWKGNKEIVRLINYFNLKANFIKNRLISGVRVEARGRLTRRFKAARAIYKLKWIGGLRNVDSSYKGLSTTVLRGHALSNVEYTVLSSKRKIGAYGVKGWVSSL